MVFGIGCDTVNHQATKNLGWETKESLRKRVFSNKELLIYDNKKDVKFLAGRFAAKEAVLKCFGTGMFDGISLTDIEILNLKNGQPNVKLKGKVKKLSTSLGIDSWFVSISHSETFSIAFATAQYSPAAPI